MRRRLFGRVESDFKIDFLFSDATHSGIITNVSESGVCLSAGLSLPRKSKIEILFPLQNETMRLPARVRRACKQSDQNHSMGVEILDAPASYLEFVKRFKYETFQQTKKERQEAETYYICSVCHHVVFTQAPFHCPVCSASIENFGYHPGAIMIPEKAEALSEIEKRHVPVIEVARGGGELSERYEVHVKVGEIEHDKSIEDHIRFIDFYIRGGEISKRCIGRVNLRCERFVPSVNVRMHNVDSSTISVISNCSAHGYWMSETTID